MTEGPWVHLAACFTTESQWVESALRNSLQGRATAVYRQNEWSTNPPLRHDGRILGVPSRLLHDARSVGRERSNESFHGTATAVCRRNERSVNPPLRHVGVALGGPPRLLHDARSVGR
ncbi:hypothetical protein TNCT_551 [Trichonephila clavata]|uniref:Uncharacterized protein n=1 Tax=Trichonephila clavata TaxID=2740835 RepID=A0A8X6HE93_TRICU|nr:hypothetical protein TNCT_551 [Trichonephila clavata]